MRILVDGATMDIPDGTTATFVDTYGKILLVGQVDGEQLRTNESVMSIDCEEEGHTEVETIAVAVPPAKSPTQPRLIQAVRVCRNQSGQIVTCPPR